MKKEIIISSTSNPKIKEILSLEKSRERKDRGLFVLEGPREIEMALKAGYKIEYVVRCPDLLDSRFRGDSSIHEWLVSREVFSKLAIRENTGGLLAIANSKPHSIHSLRLGPNPLLLVLESVEKPGNLGAVLRTADAAGADAVIICDPQTDLYNPNVIRSSVGSLFTVQIGISDSISAIDYLKHQGIQILCTYLEASVSYDSIDYGKPSAIVMGTEATGLSKAWVDVASKNIIIPMYGAVDSMNVSVSAAIVTFEAIRQRRQSGLLKLKNKS